MKKLLIASAVLASVISFASSGGVSAAANPATITVSYSNQQYQFSANSLSAQVGDTFQIVSSLQQTNLLVFNGTADVKDTSPAPPVSCAQQTPCPLLTGSTLTLLVASPGTITVRDSNGINTLATITIQESAPVIYIPTNSASLDPNGGSCTVGGEVRTTQFTVSGFLKRFPNSDECQRPGYKLDSWKSATASAMPDDLVSTYGTLFVAQWTKLIPPAPPGPAIALVNFQCAPCAKADLWWNPSPTAGATYEVVLSRADDTGKFSTVSKTSVAQAPVPKTDPFTLTDLTAGMPYRIEVFAVKDGVRSGTGALFPPVAQATPISRTDFFSSILQTPTNYADFMLAGAPAQCPITITQSGRTTVSGKPGVYAAGTAIGLPTGELLKVWVRFPGETSYTEGTAKPQVSSLGGFEWSRKTGKKTYVYFTRASDPNCKSNTVIIPAN